MSRKDSQCSSLVFTNLDEKLLVKIKIIAIVKWFNYYLKHLGFFSEFCQSI